jgi:hypothetical protein
MKPAKYLFTIAAAMLVVLALAVGCGDPGLDLGTEQQGIVNGQADGNAHPAVGALMVSNPDLFPYGIFYPGCSGTLVYKNAAGDGVFITAGHCVAAINGRVAQGWYTWDDIGVNFAEDPQGQPGVKIVAHSMDFDVPKNGQIENWAADLGVLVLKADSGSALPQPATMAGTGFLDQFSQNERKKSTLVAVGYGASVDFPPAQLYFDDKRQNAQPQYLNIVHHMIKTQQNPAAGNGGSCFGDSGGALLWKDPSGSETLIALTVGGPGLCHSIGMYYRLDEQRPQDFIANVIAGL